MLTTSAAAAPVGPAGATVPGPTKFIRVERAFYHGRPEPHAVGTVIEVPASIAAELVSTRKAVVIDKPEPVVAPVKTPPAAPAITERQKKRSKE